MVNILALNANNGDTSAALIKDGELSSFVQEERFNRIKRTSDFPKRSIEFCFKKAGISIKEVDTIFWPSPSKRYFIKRKGMKTKSMWAGGFHHKAHAASSYRLSPFKRANILVADGCGDYNDSISCFLGHNHLIEKIWDIGYNRISLGKIYKSATFKVGLASRISPGNYRGEGKMMALSSYGKPNIRCHNFFKIENHQKILNNSSKIIQGINTTVKFGEMPGKEIINFSVALQKCLEVSVINLIKEIYSETSITNFCFAGGVFLNSKLNGEISKLPFVKNIYIQPNVDDSGLSLGYAVELAARICGKKKFGFDIYSGPEYSNEEIKEELKRYRLRFEYTENPAGTAAELLQKDKIIGWFQGRMEWGPRALGNRSILANPCYEKNKIRVNQVKEREFWRPFAPTILSKEKEKWLKYARESPFMQMCFEVKKEKRMLVPAVVHVDGTTRAQTLQRNDNPLFYELIKNFYKETGIPLVLNTSFNGRNEPIVCSPKNAIETFLKMSLDYLVIGNFVVRKKGAK